MKGTSSFVIGRHKSPNRHYDLVLVNNGETRHWIIPKNIPKKYREKRIAIEEKREKREKEEKDAPRLQFENGGGHEAEDSWGSGKWEIWDKGDFEVEAANSIRLVIRASGGRFKGRYLLLVPGWGRWTGKKIWVLEKIKEG